MKIILTILIISSTLFSSEKITFYYASKYRVGVDVIVPLNGFEGKKRSKLQNFSTELNQLQKSGKDLASQGFKEIGSRPGKRFELIDDQKIRMDKLTGFTDNTTLMLALFNPDEATIIDSAHFQRYEIFYYTGPSGVGWQVNAKFKLNQQSKLSGFKSNMNSPLIAFEMLDSVGFVAEYSKEHKLQKEVRTFHQKNKNFNLKYWHELPENVLYMEGFTIQDWIAKNYIKPIARLQVINVKLGSRIGSWILSLSALPGKSTFSKAVVFSSSGSVLNNNLQISGLPINDCLGVIRLESEDSIQEYLLCRKGSWSYGSAISILKPLEKGQFEEVFSYWDVVD